MTISLASLFAFAVAMFVLAATPGPAFFALTARSMSSGVKAGAGVATGVAVADLFYFVLALLGMTTLSHAVGNAFIILKIAGGAYLVWIGIQMLRIKPVQESVSEAVTSCGYFDGLWEGLTVNLTNPKAIIFFAAILPTFFYLPAIGMIDSVIIALVIVFVGGVTDLVYVLLASRLIMWMKSDKAQTMINRVCGVTLIGVGAGVATR